MMIEFLKSESPLEKLIKASDYIEELENAIREHARTFPDEPLEGEWKLWKHVGILETNLDTDTL